MTPAEMREIKAAKYAKALADRGNRQVIQDGYRIWPAIGRTGGAENLGWELIPLENEGPIWYFATKELCIKNIPRHAKRYSGRKAGE
jgi:hypothetical protein